MEADEDLCICFHVTKRKVVNFIRIERPRRVGQLAECFGAGTGCGWCRPFLQRLFEQAAREGTVSAELPTAADYARLRASYLHEKRQGDDPAAE
jgi:NAD(P)H-nitrite reductase large subunit